MNAYPLHWPIGWPRTYSPECSRFKKAFARAIDDLFLELRRMEAKNIVLSTNVELKQNGLPYAIRCQPNDKGVAVYFVYKGSTMTFACDRWQKVEDNVHAIMKTISALRGIERWGASDMIERAFTGFVAIEHNPVTPWYITLFCKPEANLNEVKIAYKYQCSKYHPDKPTANAEKYDEVQDAYKFYMNIKS